jgi:hypothetical protein
MTLLSSSISALAELFSRGHARVPESWELNGPTQAGFWWRASGPEVVATPLLLRRASQVLTDGERVGLLLATEPRYREPWLEITAARLADLGRRGEVAELCRQIDVLGATASALRDRAGRARLAASPHGPLELALFGAPADQSAAAPGLLRVLGHTAALVEGGQGIALAPLRPVDPRDPSINWTRGRLIQGPGVDAPGGTAVLRGAVMPCANPDDQAARMAWVLETPWVALLAVLVFTAEAWEAERLGGLELELPGCHIQHFAQPPQIDVVVTLADGQEVLCGTLGELCLRVLDALGMAVVPPVDADELDRRLARIVSELLRTGVWTFTPEAPTRYLIGEGFGFDCYRGEGHRYVYLSAEDLSEMLRGVAVAWAKARVQGASREVTA